MVQKRICLGVRTRSHGTEINSKYKIAIADLKRGSDVAGSDYGTFSLRVLVNNPKENNDNEIGGRIY